MQDLHVILFPDPNPFPSAPKPLTQQNTISMEYLEQIEISESMLISRDDIRLLDSIGQGMNIDCSLDLAVIVVVVVVVVLCYNNYIQQLLIRNV